MRLPLDDLEFAALGKQASGQRKLSGHGMVEGWLSLRTGFTANMKQV